MLRRCLLAFLFTCALVAPAGATWSVVVVNRRTGEVAVGSATCLEHINLLKGLATVVPGVGAGVIQASGSATDLLPLTHGLRAGLSPADILVLVQAAEPDPRVLQSGIVSLYPGSPVTYSGLFVGRAKKGVVGEVGDLAYAIQGNVLTGDAVVLAAESALLNTPGDLGQKLLAAMQAARALGGDGRCSCDVTRPTRCGVPPPNFEKSAHVGFLALARIGDRPPPCVNANDCAQGGFHLLLNVKGSAVTDPDPIDQLTARYAEWRAARLGRPDGLLSTVSAVNSLPADGATKRVVIVRLRDIDGVALDHGGAALRVASAGGARLNALLGPVADLGDGSYRFTLSSTRSVGTDRLVITAKDDLVAATLYPYLEVRSEAPATLHCGADHLSASLGGSAPFVLMEPGLPGGAYLIVASASGTAPAIPLRRGGLSPLVRDRWPGLSACLAGDPRYLPGTRGVLDASGRAEAAFVAPPGALAPLIGARLSWTAILVAGSAATTTNSVAFDVVP